MFQRISDVILKTCLAIVLLVVCQDLFLFRVAGEIIDVVIRDKFIFSCFMPSIVTSIVVRI